MNSLWIPLAEKAYAQWNQTGKEGRDGLNAYASIQGGWMATVDAQVLGYNATDYIMTTTNEQVAINALAAKQAVTIGTLSWSGTEYGLYSSHAYAVIGYNASTDKFTLYNPWGFDQPGQLTWAQLQATCSQLAVANTSGSTPIAGVAVKLATVHASFFSSPVSGAVAELSASSLTAAPSSPSGTASEAAPASRASVSAGTLRDVDSVLTSTWEMHSRQMRLANSTHGSLSAPWLTRRSPRII